MTLVFPTFFYRFELENIIIIIVVRKIFYMANRDMQPDRLRLNVLLTCFTTDHKSPSVVVLLLKQKLLRRGAAASGGGS